MLSKALKKGAVIKGDKYTYTIQSVLQADGQGYTYLTTTPIVQNGVTVEKKTVLREHMMSRCSSRGEDGITVVTPEDIAPTVESCLESFIFASHERQRISEATPWIINVLELFDANGTHYNALGAGPFHAFTYLRGCAHTSLLPCPPHLDTSRPCKTLHA